jgi:hypothetical protein
MEGKAAEWATEQRQKWATQHTENWKATPTHTRNVVRNVPMDSFWKEFLEEWGDVRTWVEAETELAGLYQKESTVIDFWIRFRDLAQKANYPPDNNPTLCGMFRRKLSYRIQNHWTQPCHEHDIYENRLAKITAIDRAYSQPNRMRGSRAIPVVRIRRDLHPQKRRSPKCPDRRAGQ